MRSFDCAVLASVSLLAISASPALGQTAPAAPADQTPQKQQENSQIPPNQPPPTNAKGEPQNTPQEIVVTGSRVRRSTFTTPSPVSIVTRDDTILAGSRSTGEVLQNSTITSGTAQINGAFLGFVSEGGPAASTIGLRGLGSSRTLVLLNGRRLAPAGVGPQLIAADLNTLPTSVVQRIEVLREGASSVYGSDAIAGVVNVITDTSVNGVTIDGFANEPLYGVGGNLRGSITAGKTFSRGHILASFEVRKQDGVRVRDRSDFSCPTEGFTKNGQPVGSIDPATGKVSCFGYALGTGAGIASGYGIGGVIAPYYGPGVFNVGRFTYTDPNGPFRTVNGLTRVSPSPMQLLDHVISPVTTYTGYLNGSYELDALGDAELYGEALFTRRKSHQDYTSQLSLNLLHLSPNIQIFGGTYYGAPLSNFGNYPLSPFFPDNLANAGINRFTPFIIPDRESHTAQTVNYLRANGGIRGHLPFGDWRYDANLQYARTRATYTVTGTDISHLNNALETILAPAGTPANVITIALPGQAGAGNSYTCASNVTNGTYNGGNCVPLNLYDPNIMIRGAMPDNVYNYLYQDQTGHSDYDQTTLELNADGSLAQLPGGALKGAAGYVHRIDKINDAPSLLAQQRQLYNYSSSGITRGTDIVDEVYGELDAPFLKDRPFFNLLEVDASGRYTHYRSVGSAFTYHLNAQWAPISEIRFRGNYGTNFRAPNLYELFVNGISGFYGSNSDPCSQFAARFAPGSTIYNNCLAALTPILGANATNFAATAGPEVFTVGNASSLKPEKAKTYGFGVVLTAPRRIADFTFAADFWHIKLKNEVTTLGTIILDRCYEATDFPNNQYCKLIAPRLPAGNSQQGNLESFQNPFFNISQQTVSGIDFDARYGAPIGGGRFVAELQATRNLHMWFQQFSTDKPFDYVGTLGVQGFPAGPRWIGSLDLRYSTPNHITFRWGVNYVGPQSSMKLVDPTDLTFGHGLGQVTGNLSVPSYMIHGASIQWEWPNMGQFTLGMNNIFNKKPPKISTWSTSAGQYPRIGNYFNSSVYDFFGRSVFVNVTRKF